MFFDCDKQADAKVPVRFRKNGEVRVRNVPSSLSSKESLGSSAAGKPINKPSRSRRSVKANGAKLKSLRLAAGVTQEELAEQIGYSDRLIRKAEMGKRVDLKTIRSLHKHFVEGGRSVELAELTVTESSQSGQTLPVQWFERLFQQRDVAAAVGLLAGECLVCLNGVSIPESRIESVLNGLLSQSTALEFAIDYRMTCGSRHVFGWTSLRESSEMSQGTGKSSVHTVCGTTSFRIRQQQIIEIREFSDLALFFSDQYLWLQQQACDQ